MGEPTEMSCWPECRESSTWKDAISSMKGVSPSRRQSVSSFSDVARDSTTGT